MRAVLQELGDNEDQNSRGWCPNVPSDELDPGNTYGGLGGVLPGVGTHDWEEGSRVGAGAVGQRSPTRQERGAKRHRRALWATRLGVDHAQPFNSLLTNVMDAMMFPALAKLVTAYQGIYAGGRYLQCERLWEHVIKACPSWTSRKCGTLVWGRG